MEQNRKGKPSKRKGRNKLQPRDRTDTPREPKEFGEISAFEFVELMDYYKE
jgi:hypothetical protein